MKRLIDALLARWTSLTPCPGFLHHPPERSAVSTDVEATGCLGIDGNNLTHLSYLVCTRRRNQCEACPRFKAFRQGAFSQLPVEQRRMLAGSQIKADAGHRDGKAAQVHDGDEKTFRSFSEDSPGWCYTDLHPVARPGPPGVDQSKTRAKQCDAEGYGFQKRFIHGARIVAAGSVRLWLTAVLVTLWMGASVVLSDEPSEFDAMRATAAAARDVEREGALLAGITR